jgi:hypothetical protein
LFGLTFGPRHAITKGCLALGSDKFQFLRARASSRAMLVVS